VTEFRFRKEGAKEIAIERGRREREREER